MIPTTGKRRPRPEVWHVIDLLENPQLARGDQILATPTLVRWRPIKKIIRDPSSRERVLVALDMRLDG